MYGATFGNKHTYRDWGLVPAKRPKVSFPVAKTVYVDVPGSNGSIDLTESLTGDVVYKNRTIQFEYQVIEGREKWHKIYSEMADYMHGQDMDIFLDEDPDYYYRGRISMNEWKSDIRHSTIVIDCNVDPFKYEVNAFNDWLWDPFDFETGVIREYQPFTVTGRAELNIYGLKNHVIPTFTVLSTDHTGMDVIYRDKRYHLDDGASRILDFVINEGDNVINIVGTGTISIDYKGGRL